MKSFIVFLIISTIISSSLCITPFGVATSITANVASNFCFDITSTFCLQITVDTNTNFTVTPYFALNFTASLQLDGAANISNGFSISSDSSFIFGGSLLAGLKLTFSNNANIVANTGSLTIPGTYLFASLSYGLLEYSFSASAYAFVPPTTVSGFSITVPITSVGVFLAVNYNTNQFIRLPTLYSQNRVVTSTSASYTYPFGIFIDVSGSPSSFNVTFYSSNPKSASPNGRTSLGKFIDINANNSASLNANISFSYNGTNQNPKNLAIAFFSDANSTWVFPPSGLSVDTTNQIIIQSSTHFSTWALYASSSASSGASTLIIAWGVLIAALALFL